MFWLLLPRDASVFLSADGVFIVHSFSSLFHIPFKNDMSRLFKMPTARAVCPTVSIALEDTTFLIFAMIFINIFYYAKRCIF
jgi:hypothetical protein